MNLQQLGKEVQAYIKEAKELTTGYIQYREEIQRKVDAEMRGRSEAREELQNIRDNMYADFYEKSSKLEEKIESVREVELKKIEDTSESITTDVLSELTLISQLNLTSDDMEGFINKYKHNPLALRRLEEISMEQKTLNQFPPNRKEYLNVVLGRMSNHIAKFRTLDLNQYGIKIEMIADGAVSSIDEDVAVYNSL